MLLPRYSVATYYLNGALLGTHQTGYTSGIFRLDNSTPGLRFGPGAESANVLAIFIDARQAACTGWWYEGGGLFRNTYVLFTFPPLFCEMGQTIGFVYLIATMPGHA